MNEVLLLVIGGAVSGLVQLFKKHFPVLNPLYMVAVLSLVAAGFYVLFTDLGLLTPDTIERLLKVSSYSVLVYNVIKQFIKK